MIVTRRFVHVHLHKSGGTFVNECLLRFLPDARQVGYHLPRCLAPAETAALPVLGFVRNPWEYYVSWYAFQLRRARPNALFRCVSENGELDFKATIRNMLSLGQAGGKLDELLALLPGAYVAQGLNLPAFALAPIRNTELGFYSYLFRYMYAGDANGLFIGRTECLREDLLAFLERTRTAIPVPMREFIKNAPRLNTSPHAAFADYYDDATRRLVARRDGELIARFEYRFA
jgi:hypothetical protein